MDTLKSSPHKTTRSSQAIAFPVADRAATPFVTASLEEIRLARRLREGIEERYLNPPTPPVSSFWSVGAD
jgi:hypothetical protein